MKKIGFIDYYLNEWHANNYPDFIKKEAGDRYEVAYAYGKINPPGGEMTNVQWAEKMGIQLLGSIEEVIEKSDVLIVLSPDNPEMHEELTELALKSGKLVYVDKTFAPDKETALRIFENADKHNTKCYSSSALRFSEELADIDTSKIVKIYSEGPGSFEVYSIHQIEPIISLMKVRAKRVMATGEKNHPSLTIEFEDGRLAQMYQCENTDFKIRTVNDNNEAADYPIKSDYFARFTKALIAFFDSSEVPVPHEETVDVIAVREAASRAFEKPFVWIEI